MSAPNNFLEIHDSLLYNAPDPVLMGDVNFVEFKADSQSYEPGSTMNFQLRSNNEFVIMDRSYLKFTFTESGASDAGYLSTMGASAFIRQVSDTVSGLQLPICENWNLVDSINLSTDTAERKSITSRCQFTGTSAGLGQTVAKDVARTAIMPIPTTIGSSQRVWPLAVLTGGHNISYTLESYLKAYKSAAASTNKYTITNASIVCCMLKPSDSYLQELSSTLGKGNALKIPLQLTKTYNNQLTEATNRSIRIQPGYLSSLNSLTNVYRLAAAANGTAEVDSFLSNITKIQEYYINVNSQRYPRNKAIKGGADNEFLYQMLASFNTSISSLNATTAAVSDVLHYSFQSNNQWASGISLNNGDLSVEITFNDAPAANDLITSVLSYSAMLLISGADVQILTSFE